MFETLTQNHIFNLFLVLVSGIALGKLTLKGLSLGSSGVIFTALFFGHLGVDILSGVGKLGVVLFIYSVGISAGPTFFKLLAKNLKTIVVVAVIVITLAFLVTLGSIHLFNIPRELAIGLFSGALTSTPALAAAIEIFKQDSALVSVGYGIAYPCGVISVVLFVQLIPRLALRGKEQSSIEDVEDEKAPRKILRIPVIVTNPALFGKPITGVHSEFITSLSFHISRTFKEDKFIPVTAEDKFEENQIILLVGEEKSKNTVIDFIGKAYEGSLSYEQLSARERLRVVITSKEFTGKKIKDTNIFQRFGVIVTRINRFGYSFIPNSETKLEFADELTAVGAIDTVNKFASIAGHRIKAIHETKILSLLLGILIGIFVGMIPLSLPGSEPFKLGAAGGPLVVALVLGHFGYVGAIAGRIPPAALNIMRELGLILFLAEAGINAGGQFQSILAEYGVILLVISTIIAITPLVVGLAVSYYTYKMNIYEALGGLCGSMTSTPALGALTSQTDSEKPVANYAAAYPIALVLTICAVQLLS